MKSEPCALCGRTTPDDNYCYGCDAFVCDRCDKSCIGLVKHTPADHALTPAAAKKKYPTCKCFFGSRHGRRRLK